MTSPIPNLLTTFGASKGAVSTSTSYSANVAAAKVALQIQKNGATLSNLMAANDALAASKTKKDELGLSIEDYIKGDQLSNAYLTSMITSGFWGSQSGNSDLAAAAGCTGGTYTSGAAITAHDIIQLNAYVALNNADIAKKNKQLSDIDAKIAANKKLISGLSFTPAGIAAQNAASTKKPKPATTAPTTTTYPTPPEFPDSTYEWNLPPHAWSLPVDPYDVNPETTIKRTDNFHSTRRGRIWYYNGYVGPQNVLSSTTGSYQQDANGNAIAGVNVANKNGFQFVWNPETFSQSTAVNMNVTPSNTDPTINLTGFAAANSTMEFTLRLDRTNDFACAKAYTAQRTLNPDNNSTIPALSDMLGITQYYVLGNSDISEGTSTQQKLLDLFTYGTEADLEYLYRTVNGTGWTGIGGRQTSNIGYLMPSLIRVDLGNQKFVGVVSAVQVNHLAFTRDMIPIRTDVDISIDLRANIQPTTNNGSTSGATR